MAQYKKVRRFPGVEYYESDRRRFRGKPDRCFYIRYRDHRGKLIRERIGWESEGVTAAYAFQLRNERLGDIRLGDEVIPLQKKRKLLLCLRDFFIEHYLPWAKENKKSWERDEQLFRQWIEPVLGDRPLKEISPLDVERVKKTMKDAGKAPRTIEYALAVLRAVMRKARKWGFYEGEIPTSRVSFPKVDNRRMRFLTPEEARALLEECRRRSRQLYEICLLSLHCGLRFSEITNLTWGDVNLEEGLIFVRDPKNRHNRFAYMTEEVKRVFSDKEPGEPSELVFKDAKGNRIKKISNAFLRAVDALGLNRGIEDPRDRVVFHTLRHTFASWLASQGTPLHVIQKLLGHRTIKMTERYSHLLPSAEKEAIKGLEDMVLAQKAERRTKWHQGP